MLVGRLLHPLVLIYILCVIFLSDNDDAENNAEIGKSIDMVYTDNPLQAIKVKVLQLMSKRIIDFMRLK